MQPKSSNPYVNAFSVITVVFLMSALISALIISVSNDLFAFIKPDTSYVLNITKPIPIEEITEVMQQNGIIENPFMFTLYAKLKNCDDTLEAFSGEIELNSQMSYREIINEFSNN